MELSLCAMLGNQDVGEVGDVGIFHTNAGETPTWYYGDGIIEVWPIMGAWGGASYNTYNFTIPSGYAGKDFWLFLEYSFAPDNGFGLKIYDDIVIDPVISTGLEERTPASIIMLDPVQRTIAIAPDRAGDVISWEVMSVGGALMARVTGGTALHADAWAPGIYMVRAQMHDGRTLRQRVVL